MMQKHHIRDLSVHMKKMFCGISHSHQSHSHLHLWVCNGIFLTSLFLPTFLDQLWLNYSFIFKSFKSYAICQQKILDWASSTLLICCKNKPVTFHRGWWRCWNLLSPLVKRQMPQRKCLSLPTLTDRALPPECFPFTELNS